MSGTNESTSSPPDHAITLTFKDDGTLEEHVRRTIAFMNDLGFPVQEVYRYSDQPQGSVIFTPADGFPHEDEQQEPLFEALKSHFREKEAFITAYGVVSRETAQRTVGAKFNDRND